MNARKIATSIPAEQYRALERERRRLKLKRSEVVQRALALWLSARQQEARVRQYIQAYMTHPEDEKEGRAFVAAWVADQAAEDWT
jgi:metal-responsive CopG/Arc/MetJ family transcriptional regulator